MKNIKNAIVVMFDSWQFNYTGCYGNDRIKTPNIDAFAREGVLFENAYGNNMPTLPAPPSMQLVEGARARPANARCFAG